MQQPEVSVPVAEIAAVVVARVMRMPLAGPEKSSEQHSEFSADRGLLAVRYVPELWPSRVLGP